MQHPFPSLRLRTPLWQAPMAGVTTPALAAAVSSAGGLGALGLGASSAAAMATQLREFSALCTGSVHVNLFCHAPARPQPALEHAWIERLAPRFAAIHRAPPPALGVPYASVLEDDGAVLEVLRTFRPAVISFHFGVPRPEQVRALREAGAVLLGCATSPADAATIVAAGLDGVIAQGKEAGGHRGTFDAASEPDLGIDELLRQLLAARLPCPIVAAGGLADGADVARVLAAGACAAQLGSAFLLCDEAATSEAHRAAVRASAARGTVLTRALSGRLARLVRGRFTELELPEAPAQVPEYPRAYDLAKQLHAACSAVGETGYGAHWAGENAAAAREGSAAAIVLQLEREWRRAAPSS